MGQLNDQESINQQLVEAMSRAVKFNLEATFSYLEQFSMVQNGIIESKIPTLDGLEVEFKKQSRGFEFETGPIKNSGFHPIVYQDSYYGLTKPFNIHWKGNVLKVENGAGVGKIHPGKGFSTSGLLYDLQMDFQQSKNYLRAILPLTQTMHRPVKYMKGEPFVVGGSYRACGLIKLTLNGLSFRFFDFNWGEQHCLFIDSGTEVTLSEFMIGMDGLLAVYAFISGAYVRDERWMVTSDSPSFDHIKEFKFDRLADSVDAQDELLNPFLHLDYNKLSERLWLKEEVFNNLVQMSLDDRRILRAVKLIAEGRGVPVELGVSTYCVALETVKSIVLEKNEAALGPIQDKEIEESIKQALKGVIGKWPPDERLDKERLLRKIDDINKISNNEGFLKAFEVLGISLTDEDKKFIRRRNRFLHGEIPFKGEDPGDPHQFELKKVSLHLLMLTASLVLKMAGYEGPVLNFWKLWEIYRGENKEPVQLFRDI